MEKVSYVSCTLARPPGKNRGAYVSGLLLHAHPALFRPAWAVDFAELTFTLAPPPGPELPQAVVSLAEGRGPPWDEGRAGGPWPNPSSQQGPPCRGSEPRMTSLEPMEGQTPHVAQEEGLPSRPQALWLPGRLPASGTLS